MTLSGVPGTLQLNFHVITSMSQGILFLEGGLVDFIYSTVFMTDEKFVAVDGKAVQLSQSTRNIFSDWSTISLLLQWLQKVYWFVLQ